MLHDGVLRYPYVPAWRARYASQPALIPLTASILENGTDGQGLTCSGRHYTAFNHSSSQDAEAEYDRLRDLARAEGDKKKSCFDRVCYAVPLGKQTDTLADSL